MTTYNKDDEKAACDWLHAITFQSGTRKTQSQVIADMKNLIANAGDFASFQHVVTLAGIADNATLNGGNFA